MPVLKIKKEDGTWGVVADKNNVEVDTSLFIKGITTDSKAVGDTVLLISQVPFCTTNGNDRFHRVVNDIAAWSTVTSAKEASF